MRHRLAPAAPLICWVLALAQGLLGLGCQDRINGSGTGASSTLAGVLGSTDIGAVSWELWRQQVTAEPAGAAREARLNALVAHRDEFVQAINDIVNVRTLQGVATTAEALFSLVDDGTLPTLTAHVAGALELLAQDGQALDALLQLGRSQKTGIPPEELLLLLGRMFNYPETGELWSATSAIIRENDGVDDAGTPNGEPTLVPDLLSWGHTELLKVAQNGTPPSGPLQRSISDLTATFASEATVRGTFDFGPPEWVVRVDSRGLAKVAVNPATGLPEAPFVDLDRDGLADADAEGRFLDAAGAPLDLPPYGRPGTSGFDAAGRAIDGGGVLRYAYVDAKRTVLAIHMKLGGELLARDAMTHGHRLLMAALGQRQADGSYGADQPLAEMAWAGLEQLKSEATLGTTRAGAALLKSDPARAERVLVAMSRAHEAALNAARQGSTLAASRLSDPRTQQLVNDLLPLMDELSEQPGRGPSTLRTVLSTLASLRTRAPNFGAKFAPLFVHSRVQREATQDGDLNDVDEARSTPVDYASPAGQLNRSAVHQLLDLLARSDGCQFLGRSLAVWIVDSMADLSPATVGTLASLVTGLPGFLQNLLCPGTSNDIASLDALAQSGALDGFLPLAKAFKDQGETELLVRLLVRLDRSYDPLLRSIEPDIAAYLGSGILDDAEELLVEAQTIRDPRTNRAVIDLLAEGIAELVDDDGQVYDWHNQRVPTRAHLFLRPLIELDRRAAAAGVQGDLDALGQAALEVLLARATVNGQEVLQNGSLIPLLAELMGVFERNVPLDPVQRSADIAQAQRDTLSFMGSPDFGTLVALIDTIERAPSKALINRALVHLLTPQTSSPDDVFGGLARITVHLLQNPPQASSLQQLAPFLARVIDPQSPLVPGAITAFERLLTADQGNTVLNLIRAALNPAPGQSESPAAVLMRVSRAVSDAGIAAGGGAPALDAAGLAAQLNGTVAFIRDDVSGLEFLFGLIRARNRTP